MDQIAYARMAENERRHWWFSARRVVLSALLGRALRTDLARARDGARPIRILEAGCGSGGNLAMLGAFGAVDAVEYDAGARAVAQARSGLAVGACALPYDLPVPDRSYDLIALLDVLEHIEEDRASLAELGRKLAAGGRILVTVPAFPWLWSRHDDVHHHRRRYTRASLTRTVEAAGLRVEKIGYFNTLLFPLALARRLAAIAIGTATEDDRVPAGPVNAVLRAIFASERHLIGRVRMGLGLSLFALVTAVD